VCSSGAIHPAAIPGAGSHDGPEENPCNAEQVNPVREKKLTNVRTTAADEKVFLSPPRQLTLEDAIGAQCAYWSGNDNALSIISSSM